MENMENLVMGDEVANVVTDGAVDSVVGNGDLVSVSNKAALAIVALAVVGAATIAVKSYKGVKGLWAKHQLKNVAAAQKLAKEDKKGTDKK